MKNSLLFFTQCLLIISVTGCVSLGRHTARIDNNALSQYSGKKARIAVSDFDVKAAKANNEIGRGLREMLVDVLVNSNRFLVVERQALSAGTQEQESPVSGNAQTGSGVKKDKMQSADLIISTAIIEFEPQASGGRAGLGGGGSIESGALGGLLGGAMNKAHMVLDIRIIDAPTSKILASIRVQGQASDVAGGFAKGSLGNFALGSGLSGYVNTPMEKAIRVCIIEAMRYISQAVPRECYKYGKT